MREIITVQVGGGGNAIAEEFFNVLCGEHGINSHGDFIGCNPLQMERADVFFREGRENYFARAIAIDTDPDSILKLTSGPLCKLYQPKNLIKGEGSTGNNFAIGYFDQGKILSDPFMDAVRLEIETADSVQGIQVIHTLGGGTGSGLSALMSEQLSDEYKENIIQTVSIIPSPKLSSVVVEPYNCVHSFPNLLQHTQLTFCIDNEALYNICKNRLNLASASFRDANHITAHAMSGITTCLRFPGQLNTGLRKIYVNMVPFPNLHFLVPGFAPLSPCDRTCLEKLTVQEMVLHIFSTTNMLADIDMHNTKLLTVAAIFRGLISPKEVDDVLQKIREKHANAFINWIPSNINTAFCDVPPMGLEMSATFIGNSTGLTKLLTRVDDQFGLMYNRKAYLHWYTDQGMEEAQFTESRQKLYDLLEEYKAQSIDLSTHTMDRCTMLDDEKTNNKMGKDNSGKSKFSPKDSKVSSVHSNSVDFQPKDVPTQSVDDAIKSNSLQSKASSVRANTKEL